MMFFRSRYDFFVMLAVTKKTFTWVSVHMQALCHLDKVACFITLVSHVIHRKLLRAGVVDQKHRAGASLSRLDHTAAARCPSTRVPHAC
jgi:hypothetical protein